MSQRKKEICIVAIVLLAFGVVGSMDAADEACSWNGCGDARFEQQ